MLETKCVGDNYRMSPNISVLGSGNNGKASISKGHMVGVGKMDDAEYDMLG